MRDRLAAAAIEERLRQALEPALSPERGTATLAAALAPLAPRAQALVLAWVDVIAKTNTELAYRFAHRAADAARLMPASAIEQWIVRALDVYDQDGLYPACAVLDDARAFAAEAARSDAVTFDEVARTLHAFVRGLSGRELKLEVADHAYTDTATLFLPARIARFGARADNFRLYKALAAHLWAQVYHGTFRTSARGETFPRHAQRFADPAKVTALFHALETLRLDARLKAALPGLHREMQALRAASGHDDYPDAWTAARQRLERPSASVDDSYALLPILYHGALPAARCYQGELHPERVEQTLRARMEREKNALRAALARLADALDPAASAPRFELERAPGATGLDSPFVLRWAGKPVAIPAEVRALMGSIAQDLGDVPDEYLIAAADDTTAAGAHAAADVSDTAQPAFRYHEWDYRRRHYRKHWCVLHELDVRPLDEPFVPRTLDKYRGMLARLRRTFEALRADDRLLKKQPDGDDIDLDALVEAHADMLHGMELSARVFSKRHKRERDIAVLFLVDMSGSTKGWINDAEREALVLLCEALEVLGDRYAIYGFSGMTRTRCECYRIKRFDEAYSDAVRARIAGMRAQDYTRMGAVIRHVTKLFADEAARTKLLITLSDGRPDDSDGYRGEYGIEDTRAALNEARAAGIDPFCITIDTEARAYLPHMYGPVNYALVSEVAKLPLAVSNVYRRLTR